MFNIRTQVRVICILLLSILYRQKVSSILMYHSISRTNKVFFTVSPDMFEWQLNYLKKKGYEFVTIDQVGEFWYQRKLLPQNAVCITFDDGYVDNLIEVLPLLEKYNVPAVIYIAVDYVINGISNRGLPICNKEEVQRLAAHPLITIGGHTCSHPKLSKLSDDEAWHEIKRGKETLEKWIGYSIKHFAYPKGDYSDKTKELVKNAGFSTAVTVEPKCIDLSNSVLSIGRIPVDSAMPKLLFRRCCTMAMTVYTRLRRSILK